MNSIFIRTFIVIAFMCISIIVIGQPTLNRQKVTKNISMKIPEGFLPMSQQDLISRYNAYRKPLAMYTSNDRLIDIGINENSSPWAGEDLKILSDFYRANISNLFTEVNFINDEIKLIGGRQFVVFEFTSKVTDEQQTFSGGTSTIAKYTYIMYTIRNNKVLLFNFTSPLRAKGEWQQAAKEMMESIRIK